MKILSSVLSVFAITTIAAGTVAAEPMIVTPAGLAPGEQFRVVFVTDRVTNATSTDLSTYDSFVTTDANGATYNGTTMTWKAIISNSTTNARDHIGLLSDSTIPVFRVDGTQVSTGNLWSSSLIAPINKGISGNIIETSVWAGTNEDGSRKDGYTLGYGGVTLGHTLFTTGRWIDNHPVSGIPFHQNYWMYGISEILTVPAAVPEPSTVMLAGLGGLAAWAYSCKRKQN